MSRMFDNGDRKTDLSIEDLNMGGSQILQKAGTQFCAVSFFHFLWSAKILVCHRTMHFNNRKAMLFECELMFFSPQIIYPDILNIVSDKVAAGDASRPILEVIVEAPWLLCLIYFCPFQKAESSLNIQTSHVFNDTLIRISRQVLIMAFRNSKKDKAAF